MITIAKQPGRASEAPGNEEFLQLIPAIQRYARLAFRNLRSQEREEAICEVVANTFCAYLHLAELGQQHKAFATPLARFAVARYRAGRRVGNRQNSRDLLAVVAQRRPGFSLRTLEIGCCRPDVWVAMMIDSKTTPVPDQVAFRLDFSAWLRTQNRRQRHLAQFLALGNTPTDAAQRFRVSKPRISQLRGELQASWQTFQGEVPQGTTNSPGN